jgi:hypothetical protein
MGKMTLEELRAIRSSVKSELLKLINEELAMGKIEALYFEEYIFLE